MCIVDFSDKKKIFNRKCCAASFSLNASGFKFVFFFSCIFVIRTTFDEGEKRGPKWIVCMMKESTKAKKKQQQLELVFNAIESCHASEGAMMLVVCTGNDKIIIFSAEMQNYIERC